MVWSFLVDAGVRAPIFGNLVRPLRAAALTAILVAATTPPGVAQTAPPGGAGPFRLPDLLRHALEENRALAASRAQALAAQAGVATARAYPNPELHLGASNSTARMVGAAAGSGSFFGITQRLESPALREARALTAQANADVAGQSLRAAENDLVAEIKLRFYDVLRVEEQVGAATEDLALAEQIQARVALRVSVGEAPRLDLIRAQTDTASAQTKLAQARARLKRAQALLKALVSPSLPDDMRLSADIYRTLPSADHAQLRHAVIEANPLLRQAEADLQRARQQLELERRSVMPGIDVFVAYERDVDLNTTRAGVSFRLPLVDRRFGPIEEAQRQVQRAVSVVEQLRFELQQQFEAAWQRYESARATVLALESGNLRMARSALGVAEAAYRFGERGIIEYLDAQRQFRVLRNELIDSRFETFAAQAELERLAARIEHGNGD